MRALTLISTLALTLTFSAAALASPPPLTSGPGAGYTSGMQTNGGKRAKHAKPHKGKQGVKGATGHKAGAKHRNNATQRSWRNGKRAPHATTGFNKRTRAIRVLRSQYLGYRSALKAEHQRINRRLAKITRYHNARRAEVRTLRRARRAVLTKLSQLDARYAARVARIQSSPYGSWTVGSVWGGWSFFS